MDINPLFIATDGERFRKNWGVLATLLFPNSIVPAKAGPWPPPPGRDKTSLPPSRGLVKAGWARLQGGEEHEGTAGPGGQLTNGEGEPQAAEDPRRQQQAERLQPEGGGSGGNTNGASAFLLLVSSMQGARNWPARGGGVARVRCQGRWRGGRTPPLIQEEWGGAPPK